MTTQPAPKKPYNGFSFQAGVNDILDLNSVYKGLRRDQLRLIELRTITIPEDVYDLFDALEDRLSDIAQSLADKLDNTKEGSLRNV